MRRDDAPSMLRPGVVLALLLAAGAGSATGGVAAAPTNPLAVPHGHAELRQFIEAAVGFAAGPGPATTPPAEAAPAWSSPACARSRPATGHAG